jgi:hypothetical protein
MPARQAWSGVVETVVERALWKVVDLDYDP